MWGEKKLSSNYNKPVGQDATPIWKIHQLRKFPKLLSQWCMLDTSWDLECSNPVQHSFFFMICCVSPVTCQLSLMPTATVTDPPSNSSPVMHIVLVCEDPKTGKNSEAQKIIKMAKTQNVCQYLRYALRPKVSSPPGCRLSAMAHTHTRLRDWIGPKG